MDRVRLGDVSERGSSNLAQKDIEGLTGNYPIYGASGYIGTVDFYHQEKDYIAVVKDGAGIGRTMFLPAKSSIIGTLQYIIPSERVFPKYLYYAVKHMDLARYYTGATIPHIYYRDYKNEIFWLPDMAKQQEVVLILEKVEKIIEEQQQELFDLDELIKSRFVEMFGDPEINPMGWNIVTIGDMILNSESGWSGNGKQREKLPGEIAVLKVSAVTKGYFIPKECKVLDDQKHIKKFVYPQKGDLLFSRANTKEMVGATAIITEDYPELILPDKLWKIRFTNSTNVFYMKYILSSKTVREKFSAASTGTSGSMYNVSMEKFRAIKIPLPPLKLQNQFAAFVRQVDKLKVANILKVNIYISYGLIEKSSQLKIVERWCCM